MTHQFKVGDTGLTKSGRPFRIIAEIDAPLPLVVITTGRGRDDCGWDHDEVATYHRDGAYMSAGKPCGLDLAAPGTAT